MKVTWTAMALSAGMLASGLGCQNKLGSTLAIEQGRVDVRFEGSENFTDFKDSLVGTERGREDLEYIIRRTIAEETARSLKNGEKVSITFLDIDLAGDYAPLAHTNKDTRLIKTLYPPRMHFRYRLTDASGSVLKEGEKRLQDTTFEFRSGVNRNESFFYDKEMLREWFRQELAR